MTDPPRASGAAPTGAGVANGNRTGLVARPRVAKFEIASVRGMLRLDVAFSFRFGGDVRGDRGSF